MKAQKILCVVLVSLLVKEFQATQVTKCDRGLFPEVTLLCAGIECLQSPCQVQLGTDLDITVKFNAPSYMENIKPHMLAKGGGVTVVYPLGDDACEDISNTNCPISKGEAVVYNKAMHVARIFPQITVALEFSIIDADVNSTITCFTFNIQVIG